MGFKVEERDENGATGPVPSKRKDARRPPKNATRLNFYRTVPYRIVSNASGLLQHQLCLNTNIGTGAGAGAGTGTIAQKVLRFEPIATHKISSLAVCHRRLSSTRISSNLSGRSTPPSRHLTSNILRPVPTALGLDLDLRQSGYLLFVVYYCLLSSQEQFFCRPYSSTTAVIQPALRR